jgi:site-specific DNA-methyltransferase (adenine-specific)
MDFTGYTDKYEVGNIKLYQADCMKLMKQMQDKYFELAIVDVPFGIGVNHNMGRRAGDKSSEYKPAVWDYEPPDREYFIELSRVSQNQIIWGANHFINLIPYSSSCWIVWDKLFSEDVSFASCELAWTSFDSVVKKFTHSSARTNGIHPTQKPVKLYEWLLKNYAKPGDKILDTHGGSFSSAIACYNLDYDYTGMEIDADYFNAGKNRLIEHMKQGRLYDVNPKRI